MNWKYISLIVLLIGIYGCKEKEMKPWWTELIITDYQTVGPLLDTTTQLASMTYVYNWSKSDTLSLKDKLENTFELDGIISKYPSHFLNSKMYFDSIQKNSLNILIHVFNEQVFMDKYSEIPTYIVDTNSWNAHPFGKAYIPPYDFVQKYPVVLMNNGEKIVALENQDGKLVCIIEAKNQKGIWKPIEHFNYSGCGNSLFYHVLPPQSKIIFGINKYKGTFKTEMRLKLISTGKTFYSNSFSGSINLGQFQEPPVYGFAYNRYLDKFETL